MKRTARLSFFKHPERGEAGFVVYVRFLEGRHQHRSIEEGLHLEGPRLCSMRSSRTCRITSFTSSTVVRCPLALKTHMPCFFRTGACFLMGRSTICESVCFNS